MLSFRSLSIKNLFTLNFARASPFYELYQPTCSLVVDEVAFEFRLSLQRLTLHGNSSTNQGQWQRFNTPHLAKAQRTQERQQRCRFHPTVTVSRRHGFDEADKQSWFNSWAHRRFVSSVAEPASKRNARTDLSETRLVRNGCSQRLTLVFMTRARWVLSVQRAASKRYVHTTINM